MTIVSKKSEGEWPTREVDLKIEKGEEKFVIVQEKTSVKEKDGRCSMVTRSPAGRERHGGVDDRISRLADLQDRGGHCPTLQMGGGGAQPTWDHLLGIRGVGYLWH